MSSILSSAGSKTSSFDLPPEILLPTLEKLDSVEMCKVRRVCKKWLELVEDIKQLWCKLVVQEEAGKVGNSVIRMSKVYIAEEETDSFKEILQKSNKTLRKLVLDLDWMEWRDEWTTIDLDPDEIDQQ